MGPLLVALDVERAERALELAATLRGTVGGFKIGSQLFTACGPSIVRSLAERGDRVFLDLKFHDIPNTVAGAVRAAVETRAWMVNVHASGGATMMRAARDAALEAAARLGTRPPLVIAVTVLTSMDPPTLGSVGIRRPLLEQVVALARLAQDAGLDGVVASPQETAAIREACGAAFTIVTPGIRGASAGAVQHDQARTMGPREAIAAGATYLVVGRPITAAPEPRRAAQAIATEIAGV